MKIIAAGFSKTGTKSLAIALDELGYGVYDMLEHYWYHGEEWRKILVEGSDDVVKDFKKMYQDVDAVLDCPAFLFWEEILEAFPDAKVRITTFLFSFKLQFKSLIFRSICNKKILPQIHNSVTYFAMGNHWIIHKLE